MLFYQWFAFPRKRNSKRTKYWLHTQEYKFDKFLSHKGPMLQNPNGDYYNVMMHFKYYLPCKLCYHGSFICMTSSKLETTSRSISQTFSIQSGPFIIHRQEHPPVFAPRGVRSRAHGPAHVQINLDIQKFVRSNKYYKHCILRAKIVFTIILIMKILIAFNKNLYKKIFIINLILAWTHKYIFFKYWN